jgi:hypothetical protein
MCPKVTQSNVLSHKMSHIIIGISRVLQKLASSPVSYSARIVFSGSFFVRRDSIVGSVGSMNSGEMNGNTVRRWWTDILTTSTTAAI